jgi:hypothetical protein
MESEEKFAMAFMKAKCGNVEVEILACRAKQLCWLAKYK